MVSIENQIAYLEGIDNPKLLAFRLYLFDESLVIPNSFESEIDEHFYTILVSIKDSDKETFTKIYESLSNRQPNITSPFVHDDFLIFLLIVGTISFDSENSWLKNVVSLRSRNEISITFENLLKNNYSSTSNLPEITLFFLYKVKRDIISDDLVLRTYKSIIRNTNLIEKTSDFRTLISLRSMELVILLKNVSDGVELDTLRDFQTKFLKRIKLFASFIYFVFVMFLVRIGYMIYTHLSTEHQQLFSDVGLVLSLFGIALLGGAIFALIRKVIFRITARVFGFPMKLLKEELFPNK